MRGLDCWEALEIEEAAELVFLPKVVVVVVVVGHGRGKRQRERVMDGCLLILMCWEY